MSPRTRVSIAVVAVLAGTATGPVAQAEWRRIGPEGGRFHRLVRAGETGPLWLTSNDSGGGVHRSDDDGRSWRLANEGLPPIAGLGVSAQNGRNPFDGLYALAWAGTLLYRTTDGGAHWQAQPNPWPATNLRQALQFSPTVLFALGAHGRLARWDDHQPRRRVADTTLPLPVQAITTASDLFFGPSRLLYAVAGGGVQRSTDWGGTWTAAAGEGLPADIDRVLAFQAASHPHAGTVWLAVARRTTPGVAVLVSRDIGSTWELAWEAPAPFSAQFLDLSLATDGDALILVAPAPGRLAELRRIAATGQGGAVLVARNVPGTQIEGDGPGYVTAGGLGVFSRHPGFPSYPGWQHSESGLHAVHADALAVDGTSGALYLLGRSGSLRSVDGGAHWSPMTRGLPGGVMLRGGLTVESARPSRVWAALDDVRDRFTVALSSNRGARFAVRGGATGGCFEPLDLAAAPGPSAATSRLYLRGRLDPACAAAAPAAAGAAEVCASLRSVNSGRSFECMDAGLAEAEVEQGFVVTASGAVLAATSLGLLRSTDDGVSWSAVGAGLPAGAITALAADPNAPVRLFAAVGPELFRSDDGGTNFTPTGAALPAEVRVLLAVAGSPGLLFAASPRSVAMSTDHGVHWTDLSDGLGAVGGGDVDSLAFHPSSMTLYATAGGAGVLARDVAR